MSTGIFSVVKCIAVEQYTTSNSDLSTLVSTLLDYSSARNAMFISLTYTFNEPYNIYVGTLLYSVNYQTKG